MGLAALRTATLRCAARATPEMGSPPDVEGPMGLAALGTFVLDRRWVAPQGPDVLPGGEPMGLAALRTTTAHALPHLR